MTRWSAAARLGLLGLLTGCFGSYTPLEDAQGPTGTTTVNGGSAPSGSTQTGPLSESTTTAPGSSSTADGASGSSSAGDTQGTRCTCDEVDILMMVDRRRTLDDYSAALTGALLQNAAVIPAALDNYCSFHLGVTTPSIVTQNVGECQAVGSLIQGDEDCDALLEGRSFITEQDDIQASLMCLLSTDHPYDFEMENARPMQAMLDAISQEANAPGGCNEGFFRPGAPLVVLLVTDVDDDLPGSPSDYGSPGDPISWALDLFFLQQQTNNRSAISMIIGPDPAAPGCEAEPPSRLLEFGTSFPDGLARATSICSDTNTLADAIRAVFEEQIPMVCQATGGDSG